MLGATGKAGERERARETRVRTKHGRRHRETSIWVERKKSITITGAQCCERLQPDQSRRWSAELSKGQGARRRPRDEGRSPRSGALGRLTRARGSAFSFDPLSFPAYPLLSNGIPLRQSKAAPFIAQEAAVTSIKDPSLLSS